MRQADAARVEEHHREMFQRLRIPEDLLGRAGVRSVGHCEATQMVGDRKFDLTGIAFPYFRPGETSPLSHRIRLDKPDGKKKYIALPGHRALYFPPCCDALLGDVTALAERTWRKWLVVGLGGCWGWRAKTGTETAADGSRIPVTGPHPDLDLIALSGREVIILFDWNVTTNPKVQKAEQDFGKHLSERGARVRVARIPQNQGVNGPDDFLAAFADEATVHILDAASAPSKPMANPWAAAQDVTLFLCEAEDGIEFLELRILAREFVTKVAAPRGIGKSEWATELAIRKARQGQRVLYLERDNPRRATRERFRAWGADGVKTLRVLTREKVPPLTRPDLWALFPYAEYDLVVVDSFDSTAEGIGEQNSGKPSRAIAPLLDIAHRDGGPSVLILGNTVKTGAPARGSGVLEDREDIIFEVRDITGWSPSGNKPWYEELPPSDAASWASRASRRKQREKIRLAFVCTKFRGLEEPEPFALEINFTSEPRSLREVTDDIDRAGAEAREVRQRERLEQLDRAAKFLVVETKRRAEAGEPPLPKDRGAVPFLVNAGLGRNEARDLLKARDGVDWAFRPIEGERGKPLGVFSPAANVANSSGINPMTGANQTPLEPASIPAAEDPHLRHPHGKPPAQMNPHETRENSGTSGGGDLRHRRDLFTRDDDVSEAEYWGEL